ncbi:MAG: hypothetical protein KAI43_07765 [Candidatus Aureabacteria bacterium]|nr:hypothetical protein [Candidatus Auribacterota bacterium]
MRMHMMIKPVIFALVFSIISCVSLSTFASSISHEKIESSQKKIRDNLKLLERERKNYYLYEYMIRPENLLIWNPTIDGPEKFNRDTIIIDMTMDYYKKIERGETSYDPNKLAEAIKLFIHESNMVKSLLKKKMEKIKQNINSLESKTALLQEEFTQLLANSVNQNFTPEGLGNKITLSEGGTSGICTRSDAGQDEWICKWKSGTVSRLTIKINGKSITMDRTDISGNYVTKKDRATAKYTGTINGKKLKGERTWKYKGQSKKGPWTGSIE